MAEVEIKEMELCDVCGGGFEFSESTAFPSGCCSIYKTFTLYNVYTSYIQNKITKMWMRALHSMGSLCLCALKWDYEMGVEKE